MATSGPKTVAKASFRQDPDLEAKYISPSAADRRVGRPWYPRMSLSGLLEPFRFIRMRTDVRGTLALAKDAPNASIGRSNDLRGSGYQH